MRFVDVFKSLGHKERRFGYVFGEFGGFRDLGLEGWRAGGLRVSGTGYRVQGTGYRVITGYRVQGWRASGF